MEEEYIVVRFGEDGVDLNAYSRTEMYAWLEEAVEEEYEFLTEVPEDASYVESGWHLVIKGEIVVPKAKMIAKEYEID